MRAQDATPRTTLLTTKDVADLMRVDKSTIYRMAEAGRIPAVKVGRQWRFPEDQVLEWLQARRARAGPLGRDPLAGHLRTILPAASIQEMAELLGEVLGTMVLVTDMEGEPITDVSNPCGLFQAVRGYPGVMQRCIAGWQELAGDLDLEPRWKPTPLGFLCARSLIRVGDELKGTLMVGGVAPDPWPPGSGWVEAASADLGLPPALISEHLAEVYHLGPAERGRVLGLLPRIGVIFSRLAIERGHLVNRLGAIAALAGDPGQRSTS